MGLSEINLKQSAGNRERLLFGVVFLLFLYMFSQYVWAPLSVRVNEEKQKLKTVATQVSALKKLIETASKSLVEGNEEKKRVLVGGADVGIEKLLMMSRSGDRTNLIVDTMHYLSSNRLVGSLKFNGIEAGTQIAYKGYAVVPFDVRLEGSYVSIQRFIRELEKKEKPVLLNDIRLSVQNDGNLIAALKIGLYLVD